MKALIDWFDDRTGIRRVLHEALYENIPGGSRWRYVWGSTLALSFVTQVVTGIFLWMAYSPSAQTAWESVYYIQYEMQGGWLLRGIHHFTSHAMVILLALHLLQVVIDGAYRAPREVNFWLGLILLLIVLGLSLTGYLLPWDQKGFWATRVATNLMGLVPFVGDKLQVLVVGGPVYGHHTLTRFFALHAGVLPGLLVVVLALHIILFRRHGLCVRDPKRRPDQAFWPDQVLKDSVACLAVFAFVLLVAVWMHGAELGAPADPASPYAAARPEWYFLFLFQFLKLFTGSTELFGAIVAPGLVFMGLFLMPIVGRWRLGHGFNVAFLLGLFGGIAILTYQALQDDYYAQWWDNRAGAEAPGPGGAEGADDPRWEASRRFLAAQAEAHREAERTAELVQATGGIPPAGALSLLRSDPKTQGPKLFRQHCLTCHSYTDKTGNAPQRELENEEPPTAPNLYGIGTAEWYAGLLDPKQIAGPNYFGNTAMKDKDDGMVAWVQEMIGEADEGERAELQADVHKVAQALAARAAVPTDDPLATTEAADLEEGERLIAEDFACTDCHKFHDQGELGLAPDLTGHGTRAWLVDFISNPRHERFYGDMNDRMPAFAEHSETPEANLLDLKSIELIADWLRGDWYSPKPASE